MEELRSFQQNQIRVNDKTQKVIRENKQEAFNSLTQEKEKIQISLEEVQKLLGEHYDLILKSMADSKAYTKGEVEKL